MWGSIVFVALLSSSLSYLSCTSPILLADGSETATTIPTRAVYAFSTSLFYLQNKPHRLPFLSPYALQSISAYFTAFLNNILLGSSANLTCTVGQRTVHVFCNLFSIDFLKVYISIILLICLC